MPRLSSSQVAAIVLVFACMAWIGAITFALIYFLGLSSFVGWMIAGSMGLIAATIIGVFLFELRHAVDLTDCDGHPEFEERPLPGYRAASPAATMTQVLPAQALLVSNKLR